jgi:hypothetical protein
VLLTEEEEAVASEARRQRNQVDLHPLPPAPHRSGPLFPCSFCVSEMMHVGGSEGEDLGRGPTWATGEHNPFSTW